MLKFGPTFSLELIAAGISNGISWNPTFGTYIVDPTIFTPQMMATLANVIAAHNPANVIMTNSYDYQSFLALFTAQELSNIMASLDVKVKTFLIAHAGSNVTLSDQLVINAINYLVTLLLLTPARAAAILASTRPQ